jgi:hypothetical protein
MRTFSLWLVIFRRYLSFLHYAEESTVRLIRLTFGWLRFSPYVNGNRGWVNYTPMTFEVISSVFRTVFMRCVLFDAQFIPSSNSWYGTKTLLLRLNMAKNPWVPIIRKSCARKLGWIKAKSAVFSHALYSKKQSYYIIYLVTLTNLYGGRKPE